MSSRKVFIKRRVANTKIDTSVYNGTITSIGATFDKSGRTNTGLTPEEEKIIMPKIIGIKPEDTEFDLKVQKYFQDLTIRVIWEEPYVLEIGLNEDGFPINPTDYVKYKFAIANKNEVAIHKSEAKGIKRFYIEDPNLEIDSKYDLLKLKKEAFKEFYKLSDNTEKINMILSVLGIDVRNISEKEKELEIENYIEKYPQKFIDVISDKNLEIKSFIENCITAQVITKIGNTYLDGDIELGKSLDEAVMFLKDKKNSDILVKLKARLETFKK